MFAVNLVDSVAPVNMGIWNASIWTSGVLRASHGISSELWGCFPENSQTDLTEYDLGRVVDVSRIGYSDFETDFLSRHSPESTVVVSHGCWRFATRWAAGLARRGFRWVYVPHAMLEDWSLSFKPFRKSLYLKAIEARLVQRADVIRAVSSIELSNLIRRFPRSRVELIPNGVESVPRHRPPIGEREDVILFIGRLHHGKGVAELAEAFARLPASSRGKTRLVLAGPDHGELAKIDSVRRDHPGVPIECVGPVYGQAKESLLLNARFFALPSYSEGFPTSLIEAMGAGCVPIMTDQCNFPEALSSGLGIRVEPAVESIRNGLRRALSMTQNEVQNLSEKAALCVERGYTASTIAAEQAELVTELLSDRTATRRAA